VNILLRFNRYLEESKLLTRYLSTWLEST